jgi:hypothetical protein
LHSTWCATAPTVCVFLCFTYSTLVQQGPGVEPQAGNCLSTLRPYSDAGCADLPLTLLDAPVNIGETRVTVRRPKTKTSAGRRFGRTAGVGAGGVGGVGAGGVGGVGAGGVGGAATYNSSRTGPHVPVRHNHNVVLNIIGVAARYFPTDIQPISNRSPWGIGSDVGL